MKLAAIQLNSLSAIAILATCVTLNVHEIKPASAANLVINGSFEEGTNLKNGGWNTYQSLPGWSATPGGRIEVQRGAAGKAQDGQQLVELDAHSYDERRVSTIGLFQDIQTTIGRQYRLSFFYSPRPGTAATENKFDLLFGNYAPIKLDGGSGMGMSQTSWKNYTNTFVASSNVSRLQFNYDVKNDVQNTFGAYIDNVSLETVPEPGTLLGMACVGLGLIVKRRTR